LWLFGGNGLDSAGAGAFLNDLWKFDGSNWTWVTGSNVGTPAGVYGTKGTASPTNTPGGRPGAVTWTDSRGNLWLFGGHTVDSASSIRELNDLWKFDGTNWTWVSGSDTFGALGVYDTKGTTSPANVPGARDASVSWIDSGGNLWLFGEDGFDAAGTNDLLNDLWKFDGTNWTWMSGSSFAKQAGIYGTKGTASSANVPGARVGSVSWRDSGGNLWLFGGTGLDSAGASSILNDLWKFDGTNWTWVSGSNLAGQAGVFGTKGATASSNVPGARSYAVSWTDKNSGLWLFGGAGLDSAGANGSLNDLWEFDGSNWTWVDGSNVAGQAGIYGTKGTGSSSNFPGGRLGFVSWTDKSGNLWLFGGGGLDASGAHGFLNDLWRLTP
jgi:N-acetylneuraminic acid mutarotase